MSINGTQKAKDGKTRPRKLLNVKYYLKICADKQKAIIDFEYNHIRPSMNEMNEGILKQRRIKSML